MEIKNLETGELVSLQDMVREISQVERGAIGGAREVIKARLIAKSDLLDKEADNLLEYMRHELGEALGASKAGEPFYHQNYPGVSVDSLLFASKILVELAKTI